MKQKIDIIALILTNLAVLVLSLIYGWGVSSLVAIYWWQSIIVGMFCLLKFRDIPDEFYQQIILSQKNQAVKNVKTYKTSLIVTYGLLYGFIMTVMGAVVIGTGMTKEANAWGVLFSSLLFLVNHFFSYRFNKPRGPMNIATLKELALTIYKRAFPIFATAFIGGAIWGFADSTGYLFLVIFVIFKTAIDVRQHMVEHGEHLFVPESLV